MLTGNESINQKIKHILSENNYSVLEFSKLLNVSTKTAYNYLDGKTKIDAEKLFMICEKFEVSLSFFFDDQMIKDLRGKIETLEFVIKNLFIEKWSKEGKQNPPESIYDFPEFKAQQTMYTLLKDPNYSQELEKLMKAKKKTKEG
jgi:transcriptional regulator with XRE-family HTH domain